MESNNNAQNSNINNHGPGLTTATDAGPSLAMTTNDGPVLTLATEVGTEQIGGHQDNDTDDLLGNDVDASTSNGAGGSENSHRPESVASSAKHRRHNIQQIKALETFFRTCPKPDEESTKELGEKIGMGSHQVRNWFQNRRSQMKMKSWSQENDHIRSTNQALKTENADLKKRIQERTCSPCVCLLPAHLGLLSEKHRLLIENARLIEEYRHAEAKLREFSRGAAPPLAAPSVSQQSHFTLLLHHAECAISEFRALAVADERMWLRQFGDSGEVLNVGEYAAAGFPRLLGPCRDGFATEATRQVAMVPATAADLIGIFTDVSLWFETFSGIVAAASSRNVGSQCTHGSRDGLMQLINAELWVQSPHMPNLSVSVLRFTKMMETGRQWAVVDASIDAIQAEAEEREGGSLLTSYGLLPSGCLVEDMGNGYCKVTWIIHAEYDETAVPELFRPLLRSGKALGAHRWLETLKRKCGIMNVLRSLDSYSISPTADDGKKRVLEVAQRMTASFYAAVSGPVTLPGGIVREWRGGSHGAGGGRNFETAVRVVIWNCSGGGVAGQMAAAGHKVVSATTTIWLPNTRPQVVLDYLLDQRHRGEWDVLADGAGVPYQLGSIVMDNGLGNVVSILHSHIAGGNNEKTVILQEVCSDRSCSTVVYSRIAESVMFAITSGANPGSSFLLPSGFAILPDGSNHTTDGCLLTAACQTSWPNTTPEESLAADAFVDVVGKKLCGAIEKIKTAVGARRIFHA